MTSIYVPYPMAVDAIQQETADIKTFKLAFRDSEAQEKFEFQAGQFGVFSVFGRGEAPFGIANSPTQGRYVECSVKRVGKVTNALHELNVGDTVEITVTASDEGSGIDRVETLSDHRDASFGKAYGVLIKEMRLLSRAVFVLDREGIVRHAQLVGEITEEPDYEAVLSAAEEVLKA